MRRGGTENRQRQPFIARENDGLLQSRFQGGNYHGIEAIRQLIGQFFAEVLHIEDVTNSNIYIMKASKVGKKLSLHIVVMTDKNEVFANRGEAFHAMILFSKLVEGKAALDPAFGDLVFYANGRGERASIIDLRSTIMPNATSGCSGAPSGPSTANCRTTGPSCDPCCPTIKSTKTQESSLP